MTDTLRPALAAGYEALRPWAALLDRINVYPVADGDTGRNLVTSLAPLAAAEVPASDTVEALLLAARGNSGNIASQFFSCLVERPGLADLPAAVAQGSAQGRRAIGEPQEGTMLSLCEALTEALAESAPPEDVSEDWAKALLDRLAEAVARTQTQQPSLERAAVVDAGALGLFIMLGGLLEHLQPRVADLASVAQRFGDSLRLDPAWEPLPEDGFCLDAVIRSQDEDRLRSQLEALGDSVVSFARGDHCKVHVHARDPAAAREALADFGEVLSWEVDDLGAQAARFEKQRAAAPIHLMTDAAGTFIADDAVRLDVTLLDSYIQVDDDSIAESRLPQARLYEAMRRARKVSTSQASQTERHRRYEAALQRGEQVLYLCVGSVYTGNYEAACRWRDEQGVVDRFAVIDSGAASGRLGLVALALARFLKREQTLAAAVGLAEALLGTAEEWICLDRLTWLARGGRLSKTAAFFGNALRMKPIVTPRPGGAEKVGVVRKPGDQLPFVLERLRSLPAERTPAIIMLEYTDNEARLRQEIGPVITEHYPDAELIYRRISLTSGAHMGPGTWALACLPDPAGLAASLAAGDTPA